MDQAQIGVILMRQHYSDLEKKIQVHPLVLDFLSLEKTRAAAQVILVRETRLDILVNNASM